MRELALLSLAAGFAQVFGCGGSGTSDALLAALQRAVDDGMDIINLSLGDPSGFEAVSQLMQRRVKAAADADTCSKSCIRTHQWLLTRSTAAPSLVACVSRSRGRA